MDKVVNTDKEIWTGIFNVTGVELEEKLLVENTRGSGFNVELLPKRLTVTLGGGKESMGEIEGGVLTFL